MPDVPAPRDVVDLTNDDWAGDFIDLRPVLVIKEEYEDWFDQVFRRVMSKYSFCF